MKNSFLKSSCTCKKQSNKLSKLSGWVWVADWVQDSMFQTSSSLLHAHRAWNVSLGAVLHSSQTSNGLIFLWTRLAMVGRALLQARQAKCFTLFALSSSIKFFQKLRWELRVELPTTPLLSRATIILYELLVEKEPFGVRPQLILSGGSLLLKGIPKITNASWGRKSLSTIFVSTLQAHGLSKNPP